MSDIQAYILGGAGYGGGELLRLLSAHPAVKGVQAVSKSHAGKEFHAAHPNLRNMLTGCFAAEPDWLSLMECENPIVFSALPHHELAGLLPGYIEQWSAGNLFERIKLIDLSGDFRLDNAEVFTDAYKKPHPCAEYMRHFVYGLSEWQRNEIAAARWIANPGCFATAMQLALLPLADLPKLGFVAMSGVTGSTGSGALPGATTHHPTRANDFRAYKVMHHQHIAEVEASLKARGCGDYVLSFVPHSSPLTRGIFLTVQLDLRQYGLSATQLQERFSETYAGAHFVRLVEGTPQISAVTGSNFCDIAVHADNAQAVILVALDNLGKGMAGQAVQNMNIMCGLNEATGLQQAAYYPA
ncbi:MAG: N-acetyl-gamma-glutamyl-phosphate reductase [Gammaproteobacteria bacterium]|nr:N-acetyl-gamma-glutamyl-phosphate reductase [Gammaproteobacteria bacterium]